LACFSPLNNVHAQDTASLLQPGTKAPAFSIATPDGKLCRLSDFKGNFLFIDFWASWCPDCRKSNPAVVALHKKFKNRNIKFLGISFDKEKESWNAAIKKDSLTWTHVSELKPWKQTKVSQLYGIKWIPTFYLISPKGKVVFASIDDSQLEQLITKALGTRQ
jgi:peroxiredoxin